MTRLICTKLLFTFCVLGLINTALAQTPTNGSSATNSDSNSQSVTTTDTNGQSTTTATDTNGTTNDTTATVNGAQTTDTSMTETLTQATQAELTPDMVLQRLKDGNQRFINGSMRTRDFKVQMQATAENQYPMAVILNCMDSRTSPELMFDLGLGDIFALRIAGNVLNDDILGSMEFGTKIVGARLIAVIGHTNCGAIRGACEKARLDHLTGLLQKIQPAIAQANKEVSTHNCNNNEYIDQIAKDNVLLVMKQIQDRSAVIKKLIVEGKVGIVGGIQDLATGQVNFFDVESIMPRKTGA